MMPRARLAGLDPAPPGRDLCPALRNIRLRLRKRLAIVDEELTAQARPGALDDARMSRLTRERAEIVVAMCRILAASDRSLGADERVNELEALLGELPDCVTPKARSRVRLLIEGLCSAA
ncbi:MAG: hypothetical protein ACXWHB_09190 [Usitatibacter sp.]